MKYFLLALAIGAEILATTFLKMSNGFSRPVPTLSCIAAYFICYFSFSKAVMRMNLGVAYATWCGVGIVATTVISFLVFKEKISPIGMTGILLIIVGCILLNLYGNG